MKKLLIELLNRNALDEDQIILNDFFKGVWRKGSNEDSNDLNRIKMTLDRLVKKNYITYSIDPGHHILNETKIDTQTNIKFRCDLDNTNIQVGLTPSGYDYIVDELRKERQDIINETIKENSTIQKKTSITVAFFSAVTLVLAIFSFFKSCK